MEAYQEEFIIESTPMRTLIDDEILKNTIEHLNKGIEDGLTEQEMNTILAWVVENTRKNLEAFYKGDITNEPLFLSCGFAQASCSIPLEKMKAVAPQIEITYNTTTDFKFVIPDLQHAFNTVTFPLKTHNGTVKKQYLIDTTFRQFFTKTMCENAKYQINENYDIVYFRHPGYYLCNRDDEETINFARKLLKRGYIELTDENLKKYENAFMYSSVFATYPPAVHSIKELTTETYRKGLRSYKPITPEYDETDIRNRGGDTTVPYLEYLKSKQM